MNGQHDPITEALDRLIREVAELGGKVGEVCTELKDVRADLKAQVGDVRDQLTEGLRRVAHRLGDVEDTQRRLDRRLADVEDAHLAKRFVPDDTPPRTRYPMRRARLVNGGIAGFDVIYD